MADELINQDEIERLLQGAATGETGAKPTAERPSATKVDPAEVDKLLSPGGGVATESRPATPVSSSDEDRLLGQEDIEKLLSQAGKTGPKSQPAKEKPAVPPAAEGEIPQADIELLLAQAERALASVDAPHGPPTGVIAFQFPEFRGAPASADATTLDLIRDVELDLRIELGRTHMYLEDVLRLRKGSVVPLDKLAGDPVDIFVNGRLVAKGEVLVLNDNFCVRVTELIAGVNPPA